MSEEDIKSCIYAKRNPINSVESFRTKLRGFRKGFVYFGEMFRVNYEKNMIFLNCSEKEQLLKKNNILEEQNEKLEQQKQQVIDYIKNIDGVYYDFDANKWICANDILEMLGGIEE